MDSSAVTPGHGDTENRREHALMKLVDAPSTDGQTALFSVAASDASREESLPVPKRRSTLRWLLAAGASVHVRRPSDGMTPLLVAAAAGHTDIVSLLVTAVPTLVHDQLPDGRSALILAVSRADLSTARVLLDAGAPPEPRALDLAIARREHELIALLSR